MKKILDLSSWSRWSLSLSKGAVIGSIQHVIASTKCVAISLVLLAFLAGCDDSSSASAENSEPAALSSAEKQGSSSSSRHCEECNDEAISSDSNAESNGSSRSSSSEQNVASSSSEKLSETSSCSEDDDEYSSSSVILATPCKTETEDNCEYGELKDNRDGQTYKTVKIGDQWWMAENLNYADSVKTPSLLKRNWCYNNEPDSCSKYGRLYTWTAAIDSVKIATDSERPCFCSSEWLCYNSDRRKCVLPDTVPGICPSGWHLPHYREWDVLMEAVGGESSGDVLRSQSGWYSNGDWYDDKGLDSFGFNALPAGEGYCSLDSCYFDRVVTHAHFWTSVEIPSHSHEANLMNLWYPRREGWIIGEPKDFGHSIRCVKD